MTATHQMVENLANIMHSAVQRGDMDLRDCMAGFLQAMSTGQAPVTKTVDGIKYQLSLINYVTNPNTLYIVYKQVS